VTLSRRYASLKLCRQCWDDVAVGKDPIANELHSTKIEDLPDVLTPDEKATFYDVFWPVWAGNGFGTMTKKHTELLIFACLRKALGSRAPQTNFQWAQLLRLTPSKIKTLRVESHLAFGHLFGDEAADQARHFLADFTKLQSIDIKGLAETGDFHDATVSFVIENPVVHMVIENNLKQLGSYVDFHRNREVVRIRLIHFFCLFADDDAQVDAVNRWVKEKAREKAEGDTLRARIKHRDYQNKSEFGKLMLFVDDLAKRAKVDDLTDHLKLILKSQKERD
jgi:hypothetical protein